MIMINHRPHQFCKMNQGLHSMPKSQTNFVWWSVLHACLHGGGGGDWEGDLAHYMQIRLRARHFNFQQIWNAHPSTMLLWSQTVSSTMLTKQGVGPHMGWQSMVFNNSNDRMVSRSVAGNMTVLITGWLAWLFQCYHSVPEENSYKYLFTEFL